MKSEKQVFIVFSKYYDFACSRFTLGGIQTYLHHLIPVFQELGFKCNVFGTGYSEKKETVLNNVRIVNIPTPSSMYVDDQVKIIIKHIDKEFHDKTDILLFATDCQIAPNKASKSIVIQHGVTWDVPTRQNYSVNKNNLFIFRKVCGLWKKVKKISMAKNVVCVDYNYVNWYRATTAYEAVPLTVIPNFTQVSDRCIKPDGPIKIIFARRLEVYRGTNLFSKVMRRILTEYDNVEVTIAGQGPAENDMKKALASFGNRVEFVSYKAEDTLKMHSDKHIAVVPTIGSEGTSLSLLEAMAASCAVVCTNVGGMTNIVIDGYNGFMVSPNEEDLYNAIKTLIDNKSLRVFFAEKGYDVVSTSFTIERWREKWKRLIVTVIKGK